MLEPHSPDVTPVDPAALSLDLLKRSLTNWIYADAEVRLVPGQPFDARKRVVGRDWPPTAHTMIGLQRLNNLQCCVEVVLRDRVPGDLLEAGVWRGGAAILMRADWNAFSRGRSASGRNSGLIPAVPSRLTLRLMRNNHSNLTARMRDAMPEPPRDRQRP